MAQVEQPRMVTPEAVALEFSTANVGSRILAFLIDALIVAAVSFVGIRALTLSDATFPQWLVISIMVILIPGWYLGYFIVSETLWRGRTVGKAALGLRVVTREGGPVRFRHAAVRAMLGVVDFAIASGFFAVLFVLLTRDNQRLGDIVAGTLVLRERSGLPAPAPVSFEVPSSLEPYAATLDVSGLRIEEYQAVRTFLLRAPSLPPAPRTSLALQLASPLVERLRPPPPPGMPPELFLHCVAAVYQRRQRRGAPAYPAVQPPVPGTGAVGPQTAPAPERAAVAGRQAVPEPGAVPRPGVPTEPLPWATPATGAVPATAHGAAGPVWRSETAGPGQGATESGSRAAEKEPPEAPARGATPPSDGGFAPPA